VITNEVQFTYCPPESLIFDIFMKNIPTRKHEDFTMDCGVSLKSTKAKNGNLVQNLINLVLKHLTFKLMEMLDI